MAKLIITVESLEIKEIDLKGRQFIWSNDLDMPTSKNWIEFL